MHHPLTALDRYVYIHVRSDTSSKQDALMPICERKSQITSANIVLFAAVDDLLYPISSLCGLRIWLNAGLGRIAGTLALRPSAAANAAQIRMI